MSIKLSFLAVAVALAAGCAGNMNQHMGGRQQSLGVVNFGLQTANVIDPNRNNVLWTVLDVPHRSLQFERSGGKFTAEFELTLALRDDRGHAVQLVDDSRMITVDSYDATQPDTVYARVSYFMEAPPGEYKLEAMVTDRVAKGRGYSTQPVVIRDLFSSDLTLSDIILVDSPPREFPREDQIIPSFRQRFNTTVYAFAQARHVRAGQRLQAILRIGNTETGNANRAEIDTTASQETVNIVFPIPPAQLGLGRMEISMTIDSDQRTVVSKRNLLVRWANRQNATTAKALNDYLEPLRLIMTGQQWKEIKNASPEEQRHLLADFWQERNPDPASNANLLEEEFYWRVGEANSRFAWGKSQGWSTDRGRVYVVYGQPDEILRQYDRYSRSIEVWRYEEPAREFVFYDEQGDGRYHLIRQTNANLAATGL